MRVISQDGTIDIPYSDYQLFVIGAKYDAKAVCECGGKFKIMLREDAEKLRNET